MLASALTADMDSVYPCVVDSAHAVKAFIHFQW